MEKKKWHSLQGGHRPGLWTSQKADPKPLIKADHVPKVTLWVINTFGKIQG